VKEQKLPENLGKFSLFFAISLERRTLLTAMAPLGVLRGLEVVGQLQRHLTG
jgi:hypothetical protein